MPGTSIGGPLAANTSGPRRVATGTARDLLIGITVVRADGVVARAGGRVVKNVAGYDLGKLMIGSYGTLAVVTDATFRLHPVPASRRWVTVDATPGAGARGGAVGRALPDRPGGRRGRLGRGAGDRSVLLEGRAEGVAARAESIRGLLG